MQAPRLALPRRDADRIGDAVSVVMAVYNGRRFLPEQLGSVLAQLLPQDEVVVVDDASADGSIDWLAGVDDARIRVHRHARNCGVVASFGHALSLARHPVVFLCDQDDIWLPGKRSAFVEAFRRDERILVVVSDAQVIDADGRVVAPSFMALRGGFRGDCWSNVLRNRFLGCAMAVRRDLLRAALPIPDGVPMHDIWIGVVGSRLGQVHYIAQPLLQYRRHGGNAHPLRRAPPARMLAWRMALIRALVARSLALRKGHDGLASSHRSAAGPAQP